jgi:L-fucose mutarotase
MLKHVDPLIHPELLYAMAAMGHGDELALVDRNYPAYSTGGEVLRLDGVDNGRAAAAILDHFPLDTFVDEPLLRMEVVGAPDEITPVQAEMLELARAAEGRAIAMGSLGRLGFYERARSAFALVVTGEERPYSCFLLVKGVIGPSLPA